MTTRKEYKPYPIGHSGLLKQCNMRYFKYTFYIITILVLSFAVSSCSNDEDEEETFIFGITSQTSTSFKEISAIRTAYIDAYRRAGLKFNSDSFAPDTPQEAILKACIEAEGAILSSSIRFDASYTYEIFKITTSKKECIYRKVYGIRQYERRMINP